jgi:1-acyl-sn-glycerol-3-phosphate acyltransferase
MCLIVIRNKNFSYINEYIHKYTMDIDQNKLNKISKKKITWEIISDTIIYYCSLIALYIIGTLLTMFDRLFCCSLSNQMMSAFFKNMLQHTIADYDIKVVNRELYNQPKTIYVSHHYSYTDSTTLYLALGQINYVVASFPVTPYKRLAKFATTGTMLYNTYLFNHLSDTNGMKLIVIERGNNAYEKMKSDMIDRKIDNIWIFPSGTIVKSEFRTGAFRLAKELGYRICPVQLNGFNDYNKDNNYIKNKNMEVIFKESFSMDNKTPEEARDFCQTLLTK